MKWNKFKDIRPEPNKEVLISTLFDKYSLGILRDVREVLKYHKNRPIESKVAMYTNNHTNVYDKEDLVEGQFSWTYITPPTRDTA